ncbi:MAG: shikimate dehydrogenase [Chitinophagaceae bacterium]|nr:shikimate dehydrogenase [Chitinophagaceae bacterium]
MTIPYKQQVLPFLNDVAALPASLQACNCIRIRNGQLTGFNTDWIGFEQTLLPLLQPHHRQALVLGNGGASKAVLHVLQRLGIAYQVVSRQLHEGSDITYEQLTPQVVAQHTLIVNTTPLGTYPNVEEQPPLPYQALTTQHLLYDLVYNPATTRFMQQGRQQGATVKNGYDMLVGQAEAAWQIWNEA